MNNELVEKFDKSFGWSTTNDSKGSSRRQGSDGIFSGERATTRAERIKEQKYQKRRKAFLEWVGLLTASSALWLFGIGLKQLSKLGNYAIIKSASAEKMASDIREKYGRKKNVQRNNSKKNKQQCPTKSAPKAKDIVWDGVA